MSELADVSPRIRAVIQRILVDSGRPAPPLNDADALVATVGLDSLDLAVLVSTLEQEMGVDPFRTGRGAVRTVGELVEVYQAALREKP
jgi:acyl carrier protein